MKTKAIFLTAALIMGAAAADAQGISDILKGLGGKSDITSAVGNVIEGIFTKTDLSLEDIVGEYVSDGPAVAFKSDNFLQKAGGLAGAAALETKLAPYYDQYGLTGMPLIIDKDAQFALTVKGIKLSGDVVRNDGDGTFTFNLKVAGMKIGQFTAYIQKMGSNMDLMFDATKLKELISTVSKFSGMRMASTLSSILDSYDGACIGFHMENTSKTSTGTPSGTQGTPSGTQGTAKEGSDSASSPLDNLRDLLNRRRQ